MADESFLSRWSRLKRAEAERRTDTVPPEAVPAPVAEGEPPAALPEPVAPPTDPAAGEPVAEDLPPVDSLTAESDFTPFLRTGVPEDLHRQALRKLWASDPIYANDDGLKDYADDYTGLFKGGAVKTLYRVGKGFLDAVEEAAEKAEQADGDRPVPADETSAGEADTADNASPSGDVPEKS